MTAEQLQLLTAYREIWAQISAALSVKDDLDKHIRELKARQRALANKLAATGDPGHREGSPAEHNRTGAST